jgi:hypothetical protein
LRRFAARSGGQQADLTEPGVCLFVDEIPHRQAVVGFGWQNAVGWHDDLRATDLAHVAGDHDGLTTDLIDADAAVVAHGGDLFFAGIESGEGCHVADAAVAEVGVHDEALAGSLAVAPFGWQHRNAVEHGFVLRRILHAGGNPAGEETPCIGIPFDAFPAFMRHHAGCLEKQKTFAGIGRKDPATACPVDDLMVIGLWIEGEDTELESILSFGARMAGGGAAAGLAQMRQHIPDERRWKHRGGGHFDGQFDSLAL